MGPGSGDTQRSDQLGDCGTEGNPGHRAPHHLPDPAGSRDSPVLLRHRDIKGKRLGSGFVGARRHNSHPAFRSREILSLKHRVIVDIVIFIFVSPSAEKILGTLSVE